MKIYRHAILEKLLQFYGSLLFDLRSFNSIKDHLAALAEKLYEGVVREEEVVSNEINNYHPEYLGIPVEDLKQKQLSLADCQMTIAHEYGFGNWDAVLQMGNVPYHFLFEEAVNDILHGRLAHLQEKIQQFPELINAHSQYGHKARLLHYTASNGVEMWRQQVPENLPAITEYLLSAGADKSAKMKVYGGNFDTLSLLETSAHPLAAGILPAMRNLLS